MDKTTKISFNGLQQIRNSNQRMMDAKNQPHIKQLCSMIWQTNELHLLFADTGVGKSILAVALSDAISKGKGILYLENENEVLPVLYYDFELSDRQFKKRYTDEFDNEYGFSGKFFIDTIDFAEISNANPETKFNDLLFEKMKHDIEATAAKVLVIDNLTFLNTQSTQDTQIALEVMRRLNDLKKEFDLSILVLAHTPKRFSNSPITIIDLAGSKHLSNFADSVSALGKSSQGNSIRYWKQVKPSRSGELIFDTSNVLVCEIVKQDNFLTLNHVGYSSEYDHLKAEPEEKEMPPQINQIVELLAQNYSYEQIAKQLGISKGSITKWKNKYPQHFVSVSTVSENVPLGNMETETLIS
jgi:archaellum biogenesis ATPase FlaH